MRVFPGGVNHNSRFYLPYPLYVKRTKGQYFWDEDENQYCDYWQGHTSLILGHSHEALTKVLQDQLPNGTLYGTVNELSLRLAEKVVELVPCAEMVRLCSTGAEATTYVTRLARAYTKKRIVIKVEGGWHGYSSLLHRGVTYPFNEPESAGLSPDLIEYVKLVPFNDLEKATQIIDENKDDLACFVVEPVLGAGGCIPAKKEFLAGLKEELQRVGALLIFDEVITGFRVALGGAQQRFSVIPDLCTLGKILGGGLPIGAISGRSDILSLADPSAGRPKVERAWIGGGTFSANPMTASAGLATLNYLSKSNAEIYGKLEMMGITARKGIDEVLEDRGLKAKTTGLGSLLVTHFLRSDQKDIENASDSYSSDRILQERFYLSLMNYGIFFLPTHLGAISTEHTEEDIRKLISAAHEVASNKS